jgi:hypothetical protein
VALIHGKVTPMGDSGAKLDVAVKSTEATTGGVLAIFLLKSSPDLIVLVSCL